MLKFFAAKRLGSTRRARKIPIRLRDFNCDGRSGAALLAVCGGVLALQLPGAAAVHRLEYQRTAIAAGEWWRLLTAHLIHLDFRHAALDLAGFALLWVLFARDLAPRAWAVVFLITVAAIDGGLWVRDPGVSWYLGLSGLLHGLLAAALLVRVRRGDLEAWLLVGLLLAKLGYEQIHGAMPFAGNMPVVVDAHLYGALGGLAAAILLDSIGVVAASRSAPGEEPGAERLTDPAPPQKVHQPDEHDGAQERCQHGAQAEEALARSAAREGCEEPPGQQSAQDTGRGAQDAPDPPRSA